MRKTYLFIFLLFLSLNASLFSQSLRSQSESHYFLKIGAVTLPDNARPLPSLGFAWRTKQSRFGFDVSLNSASNIANYAFSLKANALTYAEWMGSRKLFAGCGAGLHYVSSLVLMGGPLVRGGSKDTGIITAEGVLGYQFPLTSCLLGCWQFEVSIPIANEKTHSERWPLPGFSLYFGLGF